MSCLNCGLQNVFEPRVSATAHTTYSRKNMGQKCEGNLWFGVLNEKVKRIYPENLKKIVGAVWELPAK